MSYSIKKLYPYLLIIVITSAFYVQNLKFNYAYLDDNLIVFTNYNQINSLSKIPAAFTSGYLLDNYYRPLIIISFIIDTVIAGQSSMMYHATNILIHIIFTLLVFRLLLKFKIKQSIALFCALIFALHPINLNAVSWIAGRNDLIAGLFSILSILSFINYIQTEKWFYFITHQLFFLLAMFSKEIGVVIPAAILTYLFFFNKEYLRDKRKIIRLIITWGILGISYLYVRLFVADVYTNGKVGLSVFLKNLYILFEYIAKIFYLPGIMPLYLKDYSLIIIGIVTAIFIISLVILKKKYLDKQFMWGLIFFLIFIIPSLLVIQQTKDGGSISIDCRMYLPFVGLLISLGTVLNKLKVNEYKLIISFALVIICLTIFSFIKNKPYENGKLFWTTVIKDYPNAPYNWIGLGFYYYDNQDYIKAAKCAEEAIKLNPTIDPEFYQKAALAYEKAGDLIKANSFIDDAMKIEKDCSVDLLNLINNNLKLGNYEKAISLKNDLEKIKITDIKKKEDLYSSAAYYFAYSNKYDPAIELMRKASNYQPPNPSYINDLGAFFYSAGKVDSAKKYFAEAVNLEPSNKDFQKNLTLANR
jgi:protein O-mannosyl-transferase